MYVPMYHCELVCPVYYYNIIDSTINNIIMHASNVSACCWCHTYCTSAIRCMILISTCRWLVNIREACSWLGSRSSMVRTLSAQVSDLGSILATPGLY